MVRSGERQGRATRRPWPCWGCGGIVPWLRNVLGRGGRGWPDGTRPHQRGERGAARGKE